MYIYLISRYTVKIPFEHIILWLYTVKNKMLILTLNSKMYSELSETCKNIKINIFVLILTFLFIKRLLLFKCLKYQILGSNTIY